jgi:wobble nucleotide-excising tRNase
MMSIFDVYKRTEENDSPDDPADSVDSTKEILSEILATVRDTNRRVITIEKEVGILKERLKVIEKKVDENPLNDIVPTLVMISRRVSSLDRAILNNKSSGTSFETKCGTMRSTESSASLKMGITDSFKIIRKCAITMLKSHQKSAAG